jgi:hypothetical protein
MIGNNLEPESPQRPFSGLSILLAVIYGSLEFAAIFMAPLAIPAGVVVMLKAGAVIALILLIGAAMFYFYTYLMKLEYKTNAAAAAAKYGFPTYAAWYAAQPWYARAAACGP